MRDHADRGSKLAEISPWNFPDDFPMECTANHKTLYRAYYWTVHSRYRPTFFNQVLSNNRILPISIVVFAYDNPSSLRNYTFSVYKWLVDHPYHRATRPYIVQILKRGIILYR